MAQYGNKDFFHTLIVPGTALASQVITADVTDSLVIDTRDQNPGTFPGFMVIATAQSTVNGTDFVEFQVHEAEEKTNPTTLDPATARQVDTGTPLREGSDLLALTENGLLLDVTTHPTFPVLRIDDAAQVGKVYWFTYRGHFPCIQLQAIIGGTPSITALSIANLYNGDTVNIKEPIVN